MLFLLRLDLLEHQSAKSGQKQEHGCEARVAVQGLQDREGQINHACQGRGVQQRRGDERRLESGDELRAFTREQPVDRDVNNNNNKNNSTPSLSPSLPPRQSQTDSRAHTHTHYTQHNRQQQLLSKTFINRFFFFVPLYFCFCFCCLVFLFRIFVFLLNSIFSPRYFCIKDNKKKRAYLCVNFFIPLRVVWFTIFRASAALVNGSEMS